MAITHRLNRINNTLQTKGYFEPDIADWNKGSDKEDHFLLFVGWDSEIAHDKAAIINKYEKQCSEGILTPMQKDLYINAELKYWNL